MDNYKIIHFESDQIRIRKITDTFFMPNAKFWNKLYELCNGYVKAENYLKSENLDLSIYKTEMNKPAIIRNCGLNHIRALRLDNKDFIETDFIFPSGKMISKKAEAYYNIVSKKYVMLEYRKDGNIENIKVIKHNRLPAFIKGNNVKKYDMKIDNNYFKIVFD